MPLEKYVRTKCTVLSILYTRLKHGEIDFLINSDNLIKGSSKKSQFSLYLTLKYFETQFVGFAIFNPDAVGRES